MSNVFFRGKTLLPECIYNSQIQQWGAQQCLPLSVVQLKGKHCRKPHCCSGVVDTFGHIVNPFFAPQPPKS